MTSGQINAIVNLVYYWGKGTLLMLYLFEKSKNCHVNAIAIAAGEGVSSDGERKTYDRWTPENCQVGVHKPRARAHQL